MDENEQKSKKMKTGRNAVVLTEDRAPLLDIFPASRLKPRGARSGGPESHESRESDERHAASSNEQAGACPPRLLPLFPRKRWRPAEEAALRVIDWENTGGEWDPLGPGGGGWRA